MYNKKESQRSVTKNSFCSSLRCSLRRKMKMNIYYYVHAWVSTSISLIYSIALMTDLAFSTVIIVNPPARHKTHSIHSCDFGVDNT